jgi:predicted amidophosphoribosyltransferase
MQLVAKEFCILSGFEPCFNLIKRVKMTRPQYKLSRNERSENLKNAFKVDKSYYNSDLPILIIDDICTTGSTFESMIYELKLNGIEDITCLATSSPY